MRLATPPESHTQQATRSIDDSNSSTLLMMGFPSRVTDPNPSLCACHSRPTTGGYLCSRCSSKVCSLPTTCPACSLTLILSTHLARSYHHLFPLQNWKTVSWSRASRSANKHKTQCFSCQSPFPSQPAAPKPTTNGITETNNESSKQRISARLPSKVAPSDSRNAESASLEPSNNTNLRDDRKKCNEDQTVSESGRYECGSCGQFFCIDCDVFCHEIVHNCPGCLSREDEMESGGMDVGRLELDDGDGDRMVVDGDGGPGDGRT